MINVSCYANIVNASSTHSWLPVAIISLNGSQERRRDLISAGLPTKWLNRYWPACDLRSISTDKTQALLAKKSDFINLADYRELQSLSPPEIGCARSHRNVANWLVKSGAKMALVLEDDIRLSAHIASSLEHDIASVANLLLPAALQNQAFICHLGASSRMIEAPYKRRIMSRNARFSSNIRIWNDIDPRESLWLSHSYIISRGAALRYAVKPIDVVADNWKRHLRFGYLDNIYLVDPPFFVQDNSMPSSIGGKRHLTSDNNCMGRRKSLSRIFLSYLKIKSFVPKFID